jgi:hypothetical protein
MASMLLVALTLAAAATRADAGWNYGASKFRITGTVLCQDCTKNWNTYAYNAKPIAGTSPSTLPDQSSPAASSRNDRKIDITENRSQGAWWR